MSSGFFPCWFGIPHNWMASCVMIEGVDAFFAQFCVPSRFWSRSVEFTLGFDFIDSREIEKQTDGLQVGDLCNQAKIWLNRNVSISYGQSCFFRGSQGTQLDQKRTRTDVWWENGNGVDRSIESAQSRRMFVWWIAGRSVSYIWHSPGRFHLCRLWKCF